MAKFMQLRLKDIEAATRLVGECGELWADPKAWRTHLLVGLCELTGQTVGHYVEFGLPVPGGQMDVFAMADVGWRDEEARNHLIRFTALHPNPFNSFPEFSAVLSALILDGHAVASRKELFSDTNWYSRSTYYNDFRRPAFNDDYTGSFRQHGGGLCSMVDVNQESNDRAHTSRTKHLVSLVHRFIVQLHGARLATERHRSLAGLSPRLRQTLARLLEGDGEKQVATRLQIQPATVHEYVQKLYVHFGVRSRPELMAYFIQRHPILRTSD